MQTQANGNNETSLRGIYELHGKFTAHTGCSSKTFKTRELMPTEIGSDVYTNQSG